MILSATSLAGSRRNGVSEWDIPVLLPRHGIDFGGEHPQRADYHRPGLMRLDHVVNKSMFSSYKWIGEAFLELGDLGAPLSLRQGSVYDIHRTLGSHHGNCLLYTSDAADE